MRSDELVFAAVYSSGSVWSCVGWFLLVCADVLPGMLYGRAWHPAADTEHPGKLAHPGSGSTTPNEDSLAWSKQTGRQRSILMFCRFALVSSPEPEDNIATSYKKLIRRWDSERELSLRRHRTCTTIQPQIDAVMYWNAGLPMSVK